MLESGYMSPDLTSYHARVCLTSAAFLVHAQRVLLVKHKKLGIWLVPGGHFEKAELPHVVAERECLEESGLKVQAISAINTLTGKNSQYLPLPFAINLHWISQANYTARLKNRRPHLPHRTKVWPKGCEQHLTFCYLVRPLGSMTFTQNLEETDGIGWFNRSEVDTLETTPDIKQEIMTALTLVM